MVDETVDLLEIDGSVAFDEVGEHAATSDSGELAGIAHHDHPPALTFGEVGESGEFGSGRGARFIQDDGGPCGELVARCGWP